MRNRNAIRHVRRSSGHSYLIFRYRKGEHIKIALEQARQRRESHLDALIGAAMADVRASSASTKAELDDLDVRVERESSGPAR